MYGGALAGRGFDGTAGLACGSDTRHESRLAIGAFAARRYGSGPLDYPRSGLRRWDRLPPPKGWVRRYNPGMAAESPEQKFNRLRDQIQKLYLTAYPNPGRKDCPGGRTLENLAKRARNFRDDLESDPDYMHVLHCSPCYREFLDFTEELREVGAVPEPMPRRTAKQMGKTLDQLEAVMKSVVREVKRGRETRSRR